MVTCVVAQCIIYVCAFGTWLRGFVALLLSYMIEALSRSSNTSVTRNRRKSKSAFMEVQHSETDCSEVQYRT
jgi:hypothetical protein